MPIDEGPPEEIESITSRIGEVVCEAIEVAREAGISRSNFLDVAGVYWDLLQKQHDNLQVAKNGLADLAKSIQAKMQGTH